MRGCKKGWKIKGWEEILKEEWKKGKTERNVEETGRRDTRMNGMRDGRED